MADKWCDYAVCAVRYSDNPKHVDQVQVRKDNGDTFGSPTQWSRNTAVVEIESGTDVITIYKDSNGKWKKGAKVNVVKVNGTRYLRTDRDATAADNLGSLPTF